MTFKVFGDLALPVSLTSSSSTFSLIHGTLAKLAFLLCFKRAQFFPGLASLLLLRLVQGFLSLPQTSPW